MNGQRATSERVRRKERKRDEGKKRGTLDGAFARVNPIQPSSCPSSSAVKSRTFHLPCVPCPLSFFDLLPSRPPSQARACLWFLSLSLSVVCLFCLFCPVCWCNGARQGRPGKREEIQSNLLAHSFCHIPVCVCVCACARVCVCVCVPSVLSASLCCVRLLFAAMRETGASGPRYILPSLNATTMARAYEK